MSYGEKIYLVRHGDYGFDYNLNEQGREHDAPAASDRLRLRGVGVRAVLLSSDAPRAAQTAEIIGRGLGIDPVYLSRIIRQRGNDAWGIENLDEVIEKALGEVGVEVDEAEDDLVVVTHAPMIAVARHVLPSEVDYGEVYEYRRGSWDNPLARS